LRSPRLHAESDGGPDPCERARRQEHVARVPDQMDHPTWHDLAYDRRQPEGNLLGIERRVRTRTSYGRGERPPETREPISRRWPDDRHAVLRGTGRPRHRSEVVICEVV